MRGPGAGGVPSDWRHYPTDPHPTEPPYVVLADSEGNRFCVSGRREPPVR
ncbi:hypothetical protein LADH09A_005836 [Micromonospora sp. LAH09]|nr:hypothetical protein [Micromonospora cabrerizensis]MCG5467342.1 hypothetical protein [Micromonospora cabrerizensis]